MDEKLLKHMAASSFSLMLFVVLVSVVISYHGQTLTYAGSDGLKSASLNGQNKGYLSNGDSDKGQDGDVKTAQDDSIKQQLGEKYIIIKKPESSYYNVKLEDLYMDRSVRLTITDLTEEVFNGTSLARINQGYEFTGIPDKKAADTNEIPEKQSGKEAAALPARLNGKEDNLLIPKVISATGKVTDYGNLSQKTVPDPVTDFRIDYKQEKDGTSLTATINIALDFIYAPVLYQDESYIYIDLRRPQDVYDKIVVIDAGHGGKDCGTFSKDEQYYEKDMNLGMVLKLKEILDREDIKVYYTRTSDETIFLNPRVNFANDVEADLFISIHCNSNESAVPRGSEVLYNEKQQGDGFTSKWLAEIALDEITQVTHKVNRGLVPGSEMVVVGKSKVPVVLIEVAFMSNQEDLNFLLKEENKIKIAESVHRVILRAFDEMGKN